MRFNAVDFGSLGFASLAWAEGRGFGTTATARYWPSSPSIPMGPGGRPGPLFRQKRARRHNRGWLFASNRVILRCDRRRGSQ
jgi:hypothetical protein